MDSNGPRRGPVLPFRNSQTQAGRRGGAAGATTGLRRAQSPRDQVNELESRCRRIAHAPHLGTNGKQPPPHTSVRGSQLLRYSDTVLVTGVCKEDRSQLTVFSGAYFFDGLAGNTFKAPFCRIEIRQPVTARNILGIFFL